MEMKQCPFQCRYSYRNSGLNLFADSGRVFSFGWNAHGQSGFGDTLLRDTPTELTYFHDNGTDRSDPKGEGSPEQVGSHTLSPGSKVVDIFAGAWNSVFVIKCPTSSTK